MSVDSDRWFLPLTGRWFDLFESGEKTWELRGLKERWQKATPKIGRRVELRRGYNGRSLWGTVLEVQVVSRFEDVSVSVWDETVPRSVRFEPDVIEFLKRYEEKYGLFMFVRIKLDRKQGG